MRNNHTSTPQVLLSIPSEGTAQTVKIQAFIQAVYMLSEPIGPKALAIVARRLGITQDMLISLIAVYMEGGKNE